MRPAEHLIPFSTSLINSIIQEKKIRFYYYMTLKQLKNRVLARKRQYFTISLYMHSYA